MSLSNVGVPDASKTVPLDKTSRPDRGNIAIFPPEGANSVKRIVGNGQPLSGLMVRLALLTGLFSRAILTIIRRISYY